MFCHKSEKKGGDVFAKGISARDWLNHFCLKKRKKPLFYDKGFIMKAGPTGLEPATSGLTGQCANQAAPRPQQSKLENLAILIYKSKNIFCEKAKPRLHLLCQENAAALRFCTRCSAPEQESFPETERLYRNLIDVFVCPGNKMVGDTGFEPVTSCL